MTTRLTSPYEPRKIMSTKTKYTWRKEGGSGDEKDFSDAPTWKLDGTDIEVVPVVGMSSDYSSQGTAWCVHVGLDWDRGTYATVTEAKRAAEKLAATRAPKPAPKSPAVSAAKELKEVEQTLSGLLEDLKLTLLDRAIKIGATLNVAKPLTGHGKWGKWIEQHFPLGERTAQRWMELAKEATANPSLVTDLTSVNDAYVALGMQQPKALPAPSEPEEKPAYVIGRGTTAVHHAVPQGKYKALCGQSMVFVTDHPFIKKGDGTGWICGHCVRKLERRERFEAERPDLVPLAPKPGEEPKLPKPTTAPTPSKPDKPPSKPVEPDKPTPKPAPKPVKADIPGATVRKRKDVEGVYKAVETLLAELKDQFEQEAIVAALLKIYDNYVEPEYVKD